jgi:putative DNA primase/helicase
MTAPTEQLQTAIDSNHFQELKESAIAEDIAALNFRSWNPGNENDLDEVFSLLVAEPEHRNNGTLAGKSQNDLANTLRSGGWIFEGFKGVSVKPNTPRKDKEGKIIKYESPRGTGSQQLFITRVSVRVADKIAEKFGVVRERSESLAPEAEDSDFWEWFLSTDYPIIITEGAKKAAAVVSAGYPAIALNGAWGWGENAKDMFGEIEKDDRGKSLKTLHPELDTFIDDREIVLAFDIDDKNSTVAYVEAAKNRFKKEINDRSVKVTQVAWTEHKGIDDFIAAKGIESLDKAYAKRSTKMNPPVTEDDKRRCPYFETSPAGGLWRVSLTKDDDADGYDDESAPMKKKRDRIGNHLECIAYVDNPESNGAALYLEFQTVRNKTTKWTMQRGYIVSDTPAMLSELLNRGYDFKLDKKKHLIEYLAGLGADVAKTYTIVDSTGWVNDRYVSQHKTYGDGDLKFRDIEPTSEATTEIKGSLDDWKTTVGAKCAGNSRLLLGLGVAFAAPLLALTGMESGGFHLVGDSSAGKTTTLKVAVSVTGEKHIPHWRTTTNGLEAIATAHNHSLLPLDEIAQADPRQVGEIAYMLANGQGKTRMTKSLTNRKPKTWELLFLSSGELGMGAYMAQAGVTMKGGQEVRMPDIPAVPFGSPFGVFETIHGYESSKEFARSLESGSEQNRGVAIDVFLTRLLADRSVAFDGELSARVFSVAKKLSEGTLNHAVSRVANRFGLIQVALELAHSYDILPFPVENIDWGIKKIFTDWLTNRGGDGSIEIKNACDRIHHLIVSNEFSDRVFDPRKADGQIVRNLLGYRVADIDNRTLELLVPTTVFDKEFCDGVSKPQLIAELQTRGWLAQPGSDGRSTHPRRVNGKLAKFLVFQPPNISDDAFLGVTGVTGVTAPETHTESDSNSRGTVTPVKKGGVTGVTVGDRVKVRNLQKEGIATNTKQKTFKSPKSGEQTITQFLIDFGDSEPCWFDWDVLEPIH